MPKVPTGKENAAQELGRVIRLARGSRRQQEVAELIGISDSMLSRFEKGTHVPDLMQALQLDQVLGTGTTIQETTRAILLNPMRTVLEIPRRLSVIVFPPEYIGAVFVMVAASAKQLRDVDVALVWGQKRKRETLPLLDEAGLAGTFAKTQVQEASTPLRVMTSVSLRLAYGCGMPQLSDDRILDWNDGWTS